MPDQPTIYLRQPGYRRWLGPDDRELHFEWEGIPPALLQNAEIEIIWRERDADRDDKRAAALEPGASECRIAAPKAHGPGELVVFLQDRRQREPFAEGRWNLVGVAKETLETSVVFDGRWVMFDRGRGVFPFLRELASAPSGADLAALKEARFSGVFLSTALPAKALAETAAAAAKFGLHVAPTLAGDDPRLVDTVRLLRDADGVLAYVLGTAPSLKADVHREAYLTVRRTDPARPVLALAEGEEARGWAGSVDGAILPTRASATRSAVEKTARRLALATWAMVDLAAESPHRASLARIAAGASALIFRGEATMERLEKLNSGNLEVWRNLAVRGVERQDRIPGLHVWSRRAKDDVLGPIVGTILINESDKPWTGAPSYPGRTGDSVTIPPGELKAAADGGQIK